MVTNELPRLVSAALSGATWLNWTEERQPMKPLEAACITSSLRFSLPAETESGENVYRYRSGERMETGSEARGGRGINGMVLGESEHLLVTLPNVKDLIKINSASDDSMYFLWMSWSIWLSGKKSNNKPITRNLNRGNSSSTFQYIMD